MKFYSWVAVGLGAAMGAWLRWHLGIWLNALFPAFPLGTLTANLVAAFLVGMSVEFFAQYVWASPELRLLVITGFLGGLSTFSTFSAEIVALLHAREYVWALVATSLHLVGSVLLTLAGILVTKAVIASAA